MERSMLSFLVLRLFLHEACRLRVFGYFVLLTRYRGLDSVKVSSLDRSLAVDSELHQYEHVRRAKR